MDGKPTVLERFLTTLAIACFLSALIIATGLHTPTSGAGFVDYVLLGFASNISAALVRIERLIRGK